MALPATEDFATADDPLTDKSDWGLPGAASDSGRANSGVYKDSSASSSDKMAYWASDSFGLDQYAEIDIALWSTNAGKRIGCILWAGSGNACLLVRARSEEDFEPYYYNSSGSRVSLGSAHTPSSTIATGDRMRLEVHDDALYLEMDYAGVGFIAETNWSITGMTNGPSSGAAGVYIVDKNTDVIRGDNWEGGNLAAGGGGRIMSSLANHGGLAGYGGIAGYGGGLAG